MSDPSAQPEPPMAPEKAPLLVFVHIQKTAGKTSRLIFYRQYTRGHTRLVRNYFVAPEVSRRVVEGLAAEPPKDLRVVHGHILFWPDIEWPEGTQFWRCSAIPSSARSRTTTGFARGARGSESPSRRRLRAAPFRTTCRRVFSLRRCPRSARRRTRCSTTPCAASSASTSSASPRVSTNHSSSRRGCSAGGGCSTARRTSRPTGSRPTRSRRGRRAHQEVQRARHRALSNREPAVRAAGRSSG